MPLMSYDDGWIDGWSDGLVEEKLVVEEKSVVFVIPKP